MTQIYGTFGPACSKQETLEALFRNGLTGMRLNLSHVNLVDSAEMIGAYHAAARAAGVEKPQLVIDTQGPELRLGALEAPVTLEDGMEVALGQGGLPIPSVVLPELEEGSEVLLDDGKISLTVTAVEGDCARATVQRGGVLTGRKSVKLPGKTLRLPVLTERDMENIRHAAEFGVTGLLQPFVHSGEELKELKAMLAELGAGHVQVFAKIETMEGFANLESILPEADVIVIARGDLGNDMPLWQLPAVQKLISAKCRKAGKKFMVVTQMLYSMEKAPVPTRAEVSDIFNAVLDGAASVMVTGETAAGAYPVEVIKYLANTAREAEKFI